VSFKDDLSADFREVFANPDEFGVTATIGGKEVRGLRLEEEPDGFTLPDHEALLLDVATADVPGLAQGDEIVIDGVRYRVSTFETLGEVTRIVGGLA